MNETIYLKKLEQREIKPTAIRLLILKTMMQHKEAFSLLDLENELDTVDKSTIYRTITLFLAHHLIHGIDDGTGSLKYAVCSNDCNCEVDDLHTHFYCENLSPHVLYEKYPRAHRDTTSRIHRTKYQLCPERSMFGMLSSACITIARKGNQPQSPVDIIQCRHPNLLIGCHSSNCLLFKAVIFSYIVSALLMNINQEIQYFYWGARNFLVSHFLTGSSYSFRHRQAKMTLKTKTPTATYQVSPNV